MAKPAFLQPQGSACKSEVRRHVYIAATRGFIGVLAFVSVFVFAHLGQKLGSRKAASSGCLPRCTSK
jgi:hypothetical protein